MLATLREARRDAGEGAFAALDRKPSAWIEHALNQNDERLSEELNAELRRFASGE